VEVNTFAALTMSFAISIKTGTTLIKSTLIRWDQLFEKIYKNIQC